MKELTLIEFDHGLRLLHEQGTVDEQMNWGFLGKQASSPLVCFDQNDELRYLGGIFDGRELWELLPCMLSSFLGHIHAHRVS